MTAFTFGIIFVMTQTLLVTCDPIRDLGTATSCLSNQWTCHNHKCIQMARKCDGNNDCGDNSDENAGCLDLSNSCGSGRIMCRSILKCVGEVRRCDGVDDCGDNSDEDNCHLQNTQCQRGKPLGDDHGIAYFCGLGPTAQSCPLHSYCNTDPLDRFAVCCPL